MDHVVRAALLRSIIDNLVVADGAGPTLETWYELRAILAVFGIKVHESLGGSPTAIRTYLLDVLARNDDEKIRALHSYLTNGAQVVDAGCWAPGRLRLFASYRDTHRVEVGAVRERVALAGVDMFAAHDSIDVSKEWQQVIEDALRSCDAAVAFLHHPGFRDSVWTDQEVGFCLDRRVPLLPLKYDKDPHGFLGRYQAADCAGRTPAHIGDLILTWLCEERRTQAAMAESTVTALATSDSFDQTRLILGCLVRLPAFTAEQLRRLEDTAASNQQVALAFYGGSSAPAVVNRLVTERSAPRP